MKKLVAFLFLSFLFISCFDSKQDTSKTYKLFETTNIWTFIKLNTVTGQMWQAQWNVEENKRFSSVLSSENLAKDKKAVQGRFTLYPTSNIYTFILLDTIDGATWQVQWSMKETERFTIPIDDYE